MGTCFPSKKHHSEYEVGRKRTYSGDMGTLPETAVLPECDRIAHETHEGFLREQP